MSGPLGRHGMAVMAVREGFSFESEIISDTANLSPLVAALRTEVGPAVHALRDATRGGVASALNEIAGASGSAWSSTTTQCRCPARCRPRARLLGLDPLYVANEGVLVAFVEPRRRPAW